MSTDRLRSPKVTEPTEKYCRNSIINALIKNKLEKEMLSIKDSLPNILKKENLPQAHKPSRKNSYSITPKQIQDSLSYDPVARATQAVEQFVSSRQTDSYLLAREELLAIHQARLEPDFATQVSNRDQISFSVPKDLVQFGRKIEQQSLKEFSHEIWLTGRSEILNLIKNKQEQLEEKHIEGANHELQKWAKSLIPAQQSRDSINNFLKPPIKPKTAHQRSKSTTNSRAKAGAVNSSYNYKKYHKDDYNSLQLWLEETIKASGPALETQPIEIRLNVIYSIYISAWKQLIRFTYIESSSKALLLEKLLYSTLRLFSNLISQEHICSRNLHKQREQELKSIRDMLQLRSQKLSDKYEQIRQQLNETKSKNHRLCVTYVIYEKVNKELCKELEEVSESNTKLERELSSIKKLYLKTLEVLYGKGLVEMQFDGEGPVEPQQNSKGTMPNSKTYYLLDKENKPVILGRFKSDPSACSEDTLQWSARSPSPHEVKYNKTIKVLDNQINRYWHKKQDDLDVQNTINSLLMDVQIRDTGTNTAKYSNADWGSQFPEECQQNSTQRLLDQLRQQLSSEFQKQKQSLQHKLTREIHLLQKWRVSYEQMQQKYKNAAEVNKRMEQKMKKIQESVIEMKGEIVELTADKQSLADIIESNEQTIQDLKNSLLQSEKSASATRLELSQLEKSLTDQKQNNYTLVRSNLGLKETVEKVEIKYKGLMDRINAVGPWLEKFMTQVDNNRNQLAVDWNLLTKVCEKIEQFLGEYVERDSGLFMTKI